MKRSQKIVLLMSMAFILCILSYSAFAVVCAHRNTVYLNSAVEGPVNKGSAHETTYYNVYRCIDCGEDVRTIVSVDADGHDYVRGNDEHIKAGVHNVYYSCVCGSLYTAVQECYGPPCSIHYVSVEEPHEKQ